MKLFAIIIIIVIIVIFISIGSYYLFGKKKKDSFTLNPNYPIQYTSGAGQRYASVFSGTNQEPSQLNRLAFLDHSEILDKPQNDKAKITGSGKDNIKSRNMENFLSNKLKNENNDPYFGENLSYEKCDSSFITRNSEAFVSKLDPNIPRLNL